VGTATSKAGVASLGGGANAINIVTLEDLGGGMTGGFSGQMRFNASTGDMNSSGNGNAFMHDANVYVGGGFGTIRMGKIAELNNCAFDPWACTGGAGVVAGASGTIGAAGSGLVGAQTIQSAVSYASPTFAGFSLGYQTSVSSRVNERSVLSLNYANGPVAAQLLRTDGTPNITANGALGAAATAPTDAAAQSTALSASYNFGVAKVNVFNAKSENAANVTTYDITAISASVPMGAYTLLAGYAKDKKAAATADTKMGIGASYALSKRTTLGADLFKQEQVGSGTGFTLRARHTF
jgi:hypothetical protein